MNVAQRIISKVYPTKAALLVLIGLAVWSQRGTLQSWMSVLSDREQVTIFLEDLGAGGPLTLGVLIFVQVFLAIIPGHALIAAGGYLYGFPQAFLITAITTILSSQLAFLFARRAGLPYVRRIVSSDVLNRWDRVTKKKGALFFLVTFWLPFFPSDAMCFIAGLSRVSSGKFFLANLFGRLPIAAIFVGLGSHGDRIPVEIWIWLLVAIVAGLIALYLWRKSRFGQGLKREPDKAAE